MCGGLHAKSTGNRHNYEAVTSNFTHVMFYPSQQHGFVEEGCAQNVWMQTRQLYFWMTSLT